MRKAAVLWIAILITGVLSSCSAVSPAMRYAADVENGGDEGIAATQWLNANASNAIPILIRNLGSPNEGNVATAQAGLATIGAPARKAILSGFQKFSSAQQRGALGALIENGDRQGVVTLLTLMKYTGNTQDAVDALVKQGDKVADELLQLLSNPRYAEYAQQAFTALPAEVAIPRLVPLLQSHDSTKVYQVQQMLSSYGDAAIPALADYALHVSSQPAGLYEMFAHSPQASMQALVSQQYDSDDSIQRAAGIFQALGDEQIVPILSLFANQERSASQDQVCQSYLKLIGVDKAFSAVLRSNMSTDEMTAMSPLFTSSGAEAQLSTGIISQMSSPAADSRLISIAQSFLPPGLWQEFTLSIVGLDSGRFSTLVASLQQTDQQWLGLALSSLINQSNAVNAADSLIASLSPENHDKLLTSAAFSTDNHFPQLVLSDITSSDINRSKAALQSLGYAWPSTTKFSFTEVDFMPYANVIGQYIAGTNAELKVLGLEFMRHVPEVDSNYAFFRTLFDQYHSQELFDIMVAYASRNPNEGISIKMTDGSTKTITSVNLSVTPKWELIAAQDMTNHFKTLLSYLGIDLKSGATGGDAQIAFSFDTLPVSKQYPGLLSPSYTGSQCTYTVALTSEGANPINGSGQAKIDPDETVTGLPAGTYAYMGDPVDGPNQKVTKMAFARALYDTFGLDALIAIYTNESDVVEPLLPLIFPDAAADTNAQDVSGDTTGATTGDAATGTAAAGAAGD